ncbi:hypothetical protein F5X68DRAFT_258900 [Plectosphaerella plurivora]|uniref:Uncharacterized protein n=1 Tax=Plectosphaerella plurivora TaxID=936078 RepID=A0A9P8VIL3_9PEZI|nr:hypothetical protein F5X68DRAFT_258900 [Plectosphaerella plurivora]
MRLDYLGLAIGLGLCKHASAQGSCDHYLDKTCVDAYGSASIDFEPIFKEPPTFGYGFRVYLEGEISDSLSGRPTDYRGDTNRVSAWLSYDNDMLNINPNANRSSTVAMLLTNATGTVSGGDNGCDGLLGPECAANLIDILKWSLVVDGDYPTSFRTVGLFQQTPLTNLSCPENIFDEYLLLTTLSSGLVSEFPPEIFSSSIPQPSGNASSPWADDLYWRSAEEQMTIAAIGIAARFPVPGPRAYEDIDVQLVCVRPTPVEGSSDRINVTAIPTGTPDEQGGGGGGTANDDGNDGSSIQVVWLMLGTAVAAALLPVL